MTEKILSNVSISIDFANHQKRLIKKAKKKNEGKNREIETKELNLLIFK